MRNVNTQNHSTAKTYLDKTIESKNGQRKIRLKNLSERLDTACIAFDTNKTNLERLSPIALSSEEAEDLIHCYTSPTKSMKEVRDISIKCSPRCPYCNIDTSRTLDHYLPKEEFPEYSFYSLNLIPCCHVCNSIKGIRWKDHEGKRIFLNVYFDSIPDEQFLFVDLNISSNILEIEFRIDRSNISVSHEIWWVLEKHVYNFNLIKRYKDDINAFISDEIINSAHEDPDISVEDLRWHISFQSSWLKRSFWRNYWKVVLYEEICRREDILDYFIHI